MPDLRTGKFGKGALVTAVVSVALAAGDYTDVADKVARALGVPVGWLPLFYIGLFGFALWLMRMEYESADYDFAIDPATEFLCEYADYQRGRDRAETFRVCVHNFGHRPIAASVRLMDVTPEPREYRGKLGMPLVAMGEPATTGPVTINPKDRQAFNLVTFHFSRALGGQNGLVLWHDWDAAPRTLPTRDKDGQRIDVYEFALVLTTPDGPTKAAVYELRAELVPLKSDRTFRLTQILR